MALTDVNSEDRLVQQTFADHLRDQLSWESVYAFNTETFGPHGTLGRNSEREAVLVRDLRACRTLVCGGSRCASRSASSTAVRCRPSTGARPSSPAASGRSASRVRASSGSSNTPATGSSPTVGPAGPKSSSFRTGKTRSGRTASCRRWICGRKMTPGPECAETDSTADLANLARLDPLQDLLDLRDQRSENFELVTGRQ